MPYANSFATLAQAREFAALRGVTLPAVTTGDAALTAMLVKGTDYLKAFSYRGERTYPGGVYLPWPRTGVTVDGALQAAAEVPDVVIGALCQLCIEQQSGIVLHASGTGYAVKRDKTGPLETEFAVPTGSSNAVKAKMPAVDAYLRPLLLNAGIRVGRA